MEKIKKIKIKKTVDVLGTLLQIEEGETVYIQSKDIKPSSIRGCVRNLNKGGVYSYRATEKGLRDKLKVTRDKDKR